MLISRQVDNLAIGCHNVESIKKLVTMICLEDKIDLGDKGILHSFNGIDVHQTAKYINITCAMDAGNHESGEKTINPTMSTLPQLIANYEALATVTPEKLLEFDTVAGLSYRSVIGAGIYVSIVAHPGIGFAVTFVTGLSAHPAKVHFDSLRRLARYLQIAKEMGFVLLATDGETIVTDRNFCHSRCRSQSPRLPTVSGIDNTCRICQCCSRDGPDHSALHH